MTRRIRVHLRNECFVIETEHGRVVKCTGEYGDSYLGRDELIVAAELREAGATFVDLVNDRTEVKVARGYRSRDTSVPYGKPGKIIVRDPDGPSKKAPPKKTGKLRDGVNHIIESLKANNSPPEDETYPF